MLRAAVIANSWARDAISRVATFPTTLHTLYTQLEAAIQIENKEISAKRKDIAGQSRSISDDYVDVLRRRAMSARAFVLEYTFNVTIATFESCHIVQIHRSTGRAA
jgi:hypothetical protein